MKFLYRILKQNPSKREDVIVVTSALGIFVNIIVSVFKIIVGLAVSSIAIVSEGVNNATDAVTSILTIIGTKLSQKLPDEKHPFGYGRIEYITSLVVSCLILFSGFKLLKESIHLIRHPAQMSISYSTIIIVAFAGIIKLFLGRYTIETGRKLESNALVAVGSECRNDSIVSVVTVLSSLVFIIFKISLDAYVGALISLLIFKTGAQSLKETLDEILGRPGKKELAVALYKEIRSTEGIINAADMMIHNYGPEKYSASVNIEIDHKRNIGEIYSKIHSLQLRIMHTYGVTMVFGIYAVDWDSEEGKTLRLLIADFVRGEDHVLSYHAVYLDHSSNTIYCDLVVDYKFKEKEQLSNKFNNLIRELYPGYQTELTIETEFV